MDVCVARRAESPLRSSADSLLGSLLGHCGPGSLERSGSARGETRADLAENAPGGTVSVSCTPAPPSGAERGGDSLGSQGTWSPALVLLLAGYVTVGRTLTPLLASLSFG